jgi:hypothetical protein
MEHEPDHFRFVEADFDEVVSGAQRPQVVCVIATVEFRMFLQDGVVTSFELIAPIVHVSVRDLVPCAFIAFPPPCLRPCGTAPSMAVRIE